MRATVCKAGRPGPESETIEPTEAHGSKRQPPVQPQPGAPASPQVGGADSSGSSSGAAGQGSGGSGGAGGRPERTAEDVDADEIADKMLEPAWNKLKQELKKELPPDQASLIDQMKLSDAADGDSLMRQVAQAQLGPLLASVGSDEDPYSFFLDLVKIAACLQLGTAAAVFYTCELGLGLDVGDSFRAVAGLGLGYFARIFIPIEQLVWPVYNDLLQLFSPEAIFDAGPVSPQERSRTLNSLGVTVAAAFLLPRYLLGWAVDDTLQIVLPMMLGLLFFDAAFLLALLYKLSALDRGGGSGGE